MQLSSGSRARHPDCFEVSLNLRNILDSCFPGPLIHGRIKLHLVTLIQGVDAAALQSRDVDKNIRSAIFGGDEAKSLCRIEELHRSGFHIRHNLTFSVVGFGAATCRAECELKHSQISTSGRKSILRQISNKVEPKRQADDLARRSIGQ